MSLRNHAAGTKNDEVLWHTGTGFVFSVIAWLSKSASDERTGQVERRLHRLKTLYGQLHVRLTKSIESIRSLPANTVEALYTLLDPTSDKNPFTRQTSVGEFLWCSFSCFIKGFAVVKCCCYLLTRRKAHLTTNTIRRSIGLIFVKTTTEIVTLIPAIRSRVLKRPIQFVKFLDLHEICSTLTCQNKSPAPLISEISALCRKVWGFNLKPLNGE